MTRPPRGALAPPLSSAADEQQREAVDPEIPLQDKPYRADGMDPIEWTEAVQWWDGVSELLRPRSLPRGQPEDEALLRLDEDEGDAERSLVYVASYGGVTPEEMNRCEILDAKGVIVRFQVVPPGEQPPFFGPVWTQRYVKVRGHQARLFEARRDQGSNVDFRTIRWEVQARKIAGAQVQFAIDVSPSHYSEPEQIEFIEDMQSLD